MNLKRRTMWKHKLCDQRNVTSSNKEKEKYVDV